MQRSLGDEDRKHVLGLFSQWDNGGDGWIQQDELVQALIKLGISKDDAVLLFKAADANMDGKIDYEEFVGWLFKDAPDEVRTLTRTDTENMCPRGKGAVAAKEAAGGVTPNDIKELSGKAVPPNGAVDVLACVLLLLGIFPSLEPPPTKKKKAPKVNVEQVIWEAAQKAMSRADFRRRLQNLDLDELEENDADILTKLEPYTSKVHFNTETMQRRGAGNATIGLCGWVLGLKTALECKMVAA